MMEKRVVPETSVIFKRLTRLLPRKDSIGDLIVVFGIFLVRISTGLPAWISQVYSLSLSLSLSAGVSQ
jgi:hypothetical protein